MAALAVVSKWSTHPAAAICGPPTPSIRSAGSIFFNDATSPAAWLSPLTSPTVMKMRLAIRLAMYPTHARTARKAMHTEGIHACVGSMSRGDFVVQFLAVEEPHHFFDRHRSHVFARLLQCAGDVGVIIRLGGRSQLRIRRRRFGVGDVQAGIQRPAFELVHQRLFIDQRPTGRIDEHGMVRQQGQSTGIEHAVRFWNVRRMNAHHIAPAYVVQRAQLQRPAPPPGRA